MVPKYSSESIKACLTVSTQPAATPERASDGTSPSVWAGVWDGGLIAPCLSARSPAIIRAVGMSKAK
eukprot:1292316-Prymnesium_polylepis.1